MWLLTIAVLLAGCAHKSPTAPPASTAQEQPKLRACQSCQRDLEQCQKPRPLDQEAIGAKAECMNQFMQCLQEQRLDDTPCAGMN
jgi:hypothetical protein